MHEWFMHLVHPPRFMLSNFFSESNLIMHSIFSCMYYFFTLLKPFQHAATSTHSLMHSSLLSFVLFHLITNTFLMSLNATIFFAFLFFTLWLVHEVPMQQLSSHYVWLDLLRHPSADILTLQMHLVSFVYFGFFSAMSSQSPARKTCCSSGCPWYCSMSIHLWNAHLQALTQDLGKMLTLHLHVIIFSCLFVSNKTC